MTEDTLRYPIGSFHYSGPYTSAERAERIESIATLPDRLEAVLDTLGPDEWVKSYRPGGWTVRQVVHHLPDSHLHGYSRFMFGLAEDGATIRPYAEAGWVEIADSRATPPELSLALLRALHDRWAALLRSLSDEDFRRTVYHPEHGRFLSLDELLGNYAWHGDHHLAQVASVRRGAA